MRSDMVRIDREGALLYEANFGGMEGVLVAVGAARDGAANIYFQFFLLSISLLAPPCYFRTPYIEDRQGNLPRLIRATVFVSSCLGIPGAVRIRRA
jgi:hypothetical protein